MVENNKLLHSFCPSATCQAFSRDGSLDTVVSYLQEVRESSDWVHILEKLDLDRLEDANLIALFHVIDEQEKEYCNQDILKWASCRRVGFEVRDYILRRCCSSLQVAESLLRECETRQLDNLTSQIRSLLSVNPVLVFEKSKKEGNVFDHVSMEQIPKGAECSLDQEKPRVLHASLEYVGAKVGGVGSVATELLRAMNQDGQDARVITPLYDSYVSDYYDQLEFVCVIEHPYKGKWVKSTVYKTDTQNGSVIQYFVKPDETYLKLNDIGARNNIYEGNRDSSFVERTQYFTSAATAFAASYVGPKRNTPFQIFHTQSWILSFAGQLIHQYYNPFREKAGLHVPLAHVAHIHGTGKKEQGRGMPPTIFADLGLREPAGLRYARVNMLAHAYTFSKCDIHVSNWAAKSSATPKGGYGLDAIVREKRDQGRLFGVRNGIARESYDPTNREVYGDYAFSVEECADFLSQRAKVKKRLFKEKLIPDVKKPLFLYVGRFDVLTKGIDALPSMVKKIHDLGGQCVIMGVPTGGWDSNRKIRELEGLQETHPESIRVYTDLQKDQLAYLEGTSVQKGKMLRLASDFVMVPSHKEADGLVPKEALTTGAMLISSNVEGLTDTGRGLGDVIDGEKITKDTFNAFTYKDSYFFFRRNAANAVARAMEFYRTTPREEMNAIVGRLIQESEQFDWKRSVAKINAVYKKAFEQRDPKELKALQKLEDQFYRRNFSLIVIGKTALDWFSTQAINGLIGVVSSTAYVIACLFEMFGWDPLGDPIEARV
ncbi:MAG: Glycogen synthase [Chlamydiae bacterium]|nr:Glycogen synthase [Chlamydiota bacterium]